jgi:Flp pilus assembly protein TadG
MLLLFGLLQVGLWSYGQSVAHGAAEDAARAGAAMDSSAAKAQNIAENFIDHVGHGLFENATVTVVRGGETITVTVTGQIPQFVPGFPSAVTQIAVLPLERKT